MAELSPKVIDRIELLCQEGDVLALNRNFPSALQKYWEAWDLLPVPQTEWEAATWILAAISDANFLSGDFASGRDNLHVAMHCPKAIGNPFLHLRLGQCEFELGNLESAADELTRAYMGGGSNIFENEPKYLSFLKTRIKLDLNS